MEENQRLKTSGPQMRFTHVKVYACYMHNRQKDSSDRYLLCADKASKATAHTKRNENRNVTNNNNDMR